MKIIEPGHIYQLEHIDGSGVGLLVFNNREPNTEHEGTQTQEVLRALIDRTQHCDACLRWDGNDKIIHHLRMALSLHEARALERKTEKGELQPEKVATSADGHFSLDTCMVNHLSSRVCSRGTKSCVLAHANDVRVQYPPISPTKHDENVRVQYPPISPTKHDERFAPMNYWGQERFAPTSYWGLEKRRAKHVDRGWCPEHFRNNCIANRMISDDKKPDLDPMLAAVTSRANDPLGEPKTTDYCKQCGESPESATHTVGHGHPYRDPRR